MDTAGIPSISIDQLVHSNADLMRRIKLAYGVDEPTFQRDIVTVVRRLAIYVHLLPATANSYFPDNGGLLRMSLQIAFYALQATDSHIFSGRTTITKRCNLEPRWRLATFIAGLCCELHRTLCQLVVTDEAGNEWCPYLEPLNDWLTVQQRSRYFLRWISNAQEVRALGVFAMPHIVPVETLAYLADDNVVVVPHLMACVSGMPLYRDLNVLEQLVNRATALVIHRDLPARADGNCMPTAGAHLERYLLRAMRRLTASSPAWRVNGEKSRVWLDTDGLYLLWPNVAPEIVALLEEDRLVGIPKTPDAIFQILVGAGVFEVRASGEPLWAIQPPSSDSPLAAVRLSSATILISALDWVPEPLSSLAHRRKPRKKTTVAPDPDQANQAEVAETVAPSQTDPDPPLADVIRFSVDAPVRLNRAVKDVLADIIDTMNRSDTTPAASVIDEGVFIPLSEFERRQRETAIVIRALHDCAMLVVSSDGQTCTIVHCFYGQESTGLVIHPRFILGVKPHADP